MKQETEILKQYRGIAKQMLMPTFVLKVAKGFFFFSVWFVFYLACVLAKRTREAAYMVQGTKSCIEPRPHHMGTLLDLGPPKKLLQSTKENMEALSPTAGAAVPKL